MGSPKPIDAAVTSAKDSAEVMYHLLPSRQRKLAQGKLISLRVVVHATRPTKMFVLASTGNRVQCVGLDAGEAYMCAGRLVVMENMHGLTAMQTKRNDS